MRSMNAMEAMNVFDESMDAIESMHALCEPIDRREWGTRVSRAEPACIY